MRSRICSQRMNTVSGQPVTQAHEIRIALTAAATTTAATLVLIWPAIIATIAGISAGALSIGIGYAGMCCDKGWRRKTISAVTMAAGMFEVWVIRKLTRP